MQVDRQPAPLALLHLVQMLECPPEAGLALRQPLERQRTLTSVR
jgi:hypothetical protein